MVFMLVSLGTCVYIEPYLYKEGLLNKYEEEKNIIMNKKNIKIGATSYGTDPEGGKNYPVEYIQTEKLKTNYFENEYSTTFKRDRYPEDLHITGEKTYIINELLYDKSKGNHFEKIDEYIQKNKEKIFKVFLGENWENGEAIKFEIEILRNLDFSKKNEKFYYRKYRNANIKNYVINPIDEDNLKDYEKGLEREKQFFNEKVKYEDIDWEKYIDYMGDYPVLIMYIQKKVYDEAKKKRYWIFEVDIREEYMRHTPERVKGIKEVYKEFEKYYNKDTFTFAIYE